MRILFLTSSMHGGGAERVAALLCNAWVERGDEVILMPTFSGRGGCSYVLEPQVELDYLADHVGGARSRLRRLWALRQLMRRRKPDVVVSFLTDVNIAALLASVGTGIPVVVSERIYPAFQATRANRKVNVLRRLLYPRARSVVVQTQDVADWFAIHAPGCRTDIVPNPLEFPLRSADAGIQPCDHIADGKGIILAIGRLDPQKRHDLLISAFARLASDHPEWNLVILGDGAERDALRRQIDAAGLQDRISLPGFVGNPGAWYQRANIFVMASGYEGFPNTMIEALAYGLPTVAFDIKTGPAEILQGGKIGVLLPDDDHIHRLYDALAALMSDPLRRDALAGLATTVRETYAMARILAMWDDVLHRAVNGN